MEELRDNGLSGPSQQDPAASAALWEAGQLEGKSVVDANGDELSHLTRCCFEDEAMTRCDVTLTNEARDVFEAQGRSVVEVPPVWIARVDDESVRLRKTGDEILHPDKARAYNDGARDLPRKVR